MQADSSVAPGRPAPTGRSGGARTERGWLDAPLFRQAVLLGFLRPGDRLPLIREVVEDLAINPNTVAKAYRQMEQENLVTGRPGQGTFVDERQSAAVPASTYTSLHRGLATWLRRAYAAGLDEQAVDALFASVHQQTRNEGVA